MEIKVEDSSHLKDGRGDQGTVGIIMDYFSIVFNGLETLAFIPKILSGFEMATGWVLGAVRAATKGQKER